MELFKNSTEKEQFISKYKDPFKSDNVEQIIMRIGAGLFGGKVKYRATIEFKNGNTTGEQKLQCNDFPSLVKEVEQFIKSL